MPTDVQHSPASPDVRPGSLDWWIRDKRGHPTLAQLPNPPIALWMLTVVAGWIGAAAGASSKTLDAVQLVGRGALLAWALDELLRGSSPFRRVLGAVVLVVVGYGVLSQL